jgi:hypothetical protein
VIVGWVALIGIAVLIMSALLMPAFGIPGLFYAWLGVNALVGVTGIVFLVLQKEH